MPIYFSWFITALLVGKWWSRTITTYRKVGAFHIACNLITPIDESTSELLITRRNRPTRCDRSRPGRTHSCSPVRDMSGEPGPQKDEVRGRLRGVVAGCIGVYLHRLAYWK